MHVILYNTSSPPDKVVKNLGSTSWEIEGVIFKDEGALSVIEPTVTLNIGNDIAKLSRYNYLKIPKFDRYYWFDVAETNGGLVTIKCRVDPLMSFKDDIKDTRSSAPKNYIMRSENFHNKMVVDNLLPMYSDHTLDIKTFGDNVYVDTGHVILETTGKGGTPS